MDWKDPKFSEQVLQYTLISSALIAIAAGYATSSLRIMFMVYASFVFVTLVIIIPDWPYFARHPREWMTPKRADDDAPPGRTQQQQSVRDRVSDGAKLD